MKFKLHIEIESQKKENKNSHKPVQRPFRYIKVVHLV